MVADDPESFADLDGHITSANANNTDNGNCNNGLGSNHGNTCQQQADTQSQNAQAAQQAQKPPDQVDLMMQANARKVQDAKAEQNRTPTTEDMAKTLQHAGQMGDAGVKAGLAVVSAEAIVATGVVAAPAAVPAISSAGTQALAAANSAYVQAGTVLSAAGTAISNAYIKGRELAVNAAYTVETLKSGGGGIQAAADFATGLTPGARTPNTTAGRAGTVVKFALKALGLTQ